MSVLELFFFAIFVLLLLLVLLCTLSIKFFVCGRSWWKKNFFFVQEQNKIANNGTNEKAAYRKIARIFIILVSLAWKENILDFYFLAAFRWMKLVVEEGRISFDCMKVFGGLWASFVRMDLHWFIFLKFGFWVFNVSIFEFLWIGCWFLSKLSKKKLKKNTMKHNALFKRPGFEPVVIRLINIKTSLKSFIDSLFKLLSSSKNFPSL